MCPLCNSQEAFVHCFRGLVFERIGDVRAGVWAVSSSLGIVWFPRTQAVFQDGDQRLEMLKWLLKRSCPVTASQEVSPRWGGGPWRRANVGHTKYISPATELRVG